jgi:hypothetical protein
MSYIGNTNTTQGFVPAVDYFNGNGSTVAFTLSRPVASVAQVQAVIENVPQNPGSAFTVSGSTITFTSAPPSGTSNIYVYYTSPITQVIQPGQGTVGTAQLANGLAFSQWTTTGSDIYYNTGNVGIGTSSPTNKLSVVGGDGVPLARVAGASYGLTFNSDASNGFRIEATDPTGVSSYQPLITNGSIQILRTGNTERARIDSSGNFLIRATSQDGLGISFNPENAVGAPYATFNKSYSGNATGINFKYNSTTAGGITYNNASVAYNTTSDYRLKENVAPMIGALEKVALLKPVTYTWKADGSDGQGFIAHELQEVCPDAVSWEKDAMEEDGVTPKYQGIDTSFLVATLTAAIQEQQVLITTLTERITALENK